MMRRLLLLLALLIICFLFYNLSRQIYESLQAGNRLDVAAEDLARLQKQNSELKKQLAETGNMDFLERQIRDKLNFSRPNETIMLLSNSEIDKVLGVKKQVEEIRLPNWQGWIKLFFK